MKWMKTRCLKVLLPLCILIISSDVISKGIIDALKLTPHPEGGYFKEIYRSEGVIKKESLDFLTHGDRNYSTSIYFLL